MPEYAMQFKCTKCDLPLKDGDDLYIEAEGFMSGNTPTVTKYSYAHKVCPDNNIWSTSFDTCD